MSTLTTPGDRDMGLGQLVLPENVYKRKFRFAFRVVHPCTAIGSGGIIPENFVHVASMPNFSVEETQLDYLNGRMWIPGKVTLETMTVTYYNVSANDPGITGVYQWAMSTYDFSNPSALKQSSKIKDWGATGYLYIYDGCGKPLEGFKMEMMFPTNVNFGDLDMSSSDVMNIELTLRYSRLSWRSFCPNITTPTCCSPCNL